MTFYMLKVPIINAGKVEAKTFIVHSFTPEKANELFFKEVHRKGKIYSNQSVKFYHTFAKGYIHSNKVIFNHLNEYAVTL